jgi:hypothetical protein
MKTEQIDTVIGNWYDELKTTSDAIRNNPNMNLVGIASYADRWDAIRTDATLMRYKVWRIWHEAKTILGDGMRDEMSKATRRQTDFATADEKRAKYETKNLHHIVEFRKYDRVLTQLDDLLRFLAEKQKWLDSKRFNLHHNEKKEMHLSARENLIVD